MTNTLLSFSDAFDTATEADWLEGVAKALKGGGVERITRQTRDGLAIKPLYRELDFASAAGPRGLPGQAPYLRGATAEPDAFLPWDIRQSFSHPNPAQTRAEILRDLERGVSGVELALDCSGEKGIQLCDAESVSEALAGIRPDIATIALDPQGAGTGASVAALLAQWVETQPNAAAAKLSFNIDPLGTLARRGKLSGGLDGNFARLAQLMEALLSRFPNASVLRSDARLVHEAGGTEAQELAVLIASAVETIRYLNQAGMPPSVSAAQILFTLSLDGNYGLGIAKVRAARRLWARVQDALQIDPVAMTIQAVTSARMLTRYDAWVNILRGTAACFAGATGGADIITVRPFNAALGVPEELGRRIARNTQIIAMEESGLGRVADPSGGAWFTETLSEDLAQAAWSAFQEIEREGGYAASLGAGALQARIAEARLALFKAVAKRKTPITGVSAFPLLEEITAPIAPTPNPEPKSGVDPRALDQLLPGTHAPNGPDVSAQALTPIQVAEPFERLRDRAEAHFTKTGSRPTIFLATLGPLAEHTARADFARNLFATGGIDAVTAPVLPKDINDMVAAYKASACPIAILCGADKHYSEAAEAAAAALKQAGVRTLWLAGKFAADGIDRHIFMGCDAVHELSLALSELDVA